MADEIDDGEFWLPSQFLTEEDILSGFSSDLCSPVESVAETESDEDEFLAELTRRMARNPKGLVLSGSPQSTLFPVGGGSSRGSPSGPVSPPPASANGGYFKANDAAAFYLLNAAAGKVAKLRIRTEQQQQKGTGYFDGSRGFVYQPRKQQISPHFHGFQFPQLWSMETMNHLQNRPLGLSPSAWPPLQRAQPQNLPTPSLKRESVGTGVFLPRRVNTPTESRKNKNNNNNNNNKPDSATRIRGQGNGIHGPRRSNSVVVNAHPEIQLPSEWTY